MPEQQTRTRTLYAVTQELIKPPATVTNYREVLADPTQTLHHFALDHLAPFKRAREFDPRDSTDFRNFYAGKDDVHGVLKYLLVRTSISLKMNMFGYDDNELDAIIKAQIANAHVFCQGTLDNRQAAGKHEKAILDAWDEQTRNSFAVGPSPTGDIAHTKGGVLDLIVGFNGSTNWSAAGEGTFLPGHDSPGGPKYHAQNNTLTVFINPVEVAEFSTRLDEEHAAALQYQIKHAQKKPTEPDQP